MTDPMSPEAARALLEQMDEEVQILTLVTGQLPDGSAHYAYASIPPSKYMAFKEAEARGNYDLAQFGKILCHGTGSEPPTDVIQKMHDEYGASHTFEEDIRAMSDKSASALTDK